MFNAHQYILKEIMEAEDFAAARRIQHERNQTLDQHQRPVFINETLDLLMLLFPVMDKHQEPVSFQCLFHHFNKYGETLIGDQSRHFPMKKPTDL